MGLTRCYKTEGFLHLYLQLSTIFYAISFSDTYLRSQKIFPYQISACQIS